MECYRSGGRQGSCFLADRSEGGFSLAGLIGRGTSSWRYDGTRSARFSPRRSQSPDPDPHGIGTVCALCNTAPRTTPEVSPLCHSGLARIESPSQLRGKARTTAPYWSLGVRGCETRGAGGTCGSCCAPDGVVFRCEM